MSKSDVEELKDIEGQRKSLCPNNLLRDCWFRGGNLLELMTTATSSSLSLLYGILHIQCLNT